MDEGKEGSEEERKWTEVKMDFASVRIFKLSEWVKEKKKDY